MQGRRWWNAVGHGAIVVTTIISASLAVACSKQNPDYCDEATPCPATYECQSGTRECVPIPLPAIPTLTITAAPVKHVTLQWTAIVNASEFRIHVQRDDGSPSETLATMPGSATSFATVLPLARYVDATVTVEACNGAGCVTSAPQKLTASQLVEAIGYIKASNTDAEDRFGESVAMSADGNTLVIGAPFEDSNATGINGNQGNNTATDSGAVYVFVRNGAQWTQQAYVKAQTVDRFDGFGGRVALSADGNTLVVSASGEDSGRNKPASDNSAIDSGAIYVFSRNGSTWQQQALLKAQNADANDFLGWQVVISADGSTIATASQAEASASRIVNFGADDNSQPETGAVYVFARTGSGWQQQAYLKASNADANDELGNGLAISANGDVVAASSVSEASTSVAVANENNLPGAGAVYIFARRNGTWIQRNFLKPNQPKAEAAFGVRVALAADGNTLAVAADGELPHGSVFLFKLLNDQWTQVDVLSLPAVGAPVSNRMAFGVGLAISPDGQYLVAGARRESTGVSGFVSDTSSRLEESGAVGLFGTSGERMLLTRMVKQPRPAPMSYFGESELAVDSAGNVAVGAPQDDSNTTGIGSTPNASAPNAGAVFLY